MATQLVREALKHKAMDLLRAVNIQVGKYNIYVDEIENLTACINELEPQMARNKRQLEEILQFLDLEVKDFIPLGDDIIMPEEGDDIIMPEDKEI